MKRQSEAEQKPMRGKRREEPEEKCESCRPERASSCVVSALPSFRAAAVTLALAWQPCRQASRRWTAGALKRQTKLQLPDTSRILLALFLLHIHTAISIYSNTTYLGTSSLVSTHRHLSFIPSGQRSRIHSRLTKEITWPPFLGQPSSFVSKTPRPPHPRVSRQST